MITFTKHTGMNFKVWRKIIMESCLTYLSKNLNVCQIYIDKNCFVFKLFRRIQTVSKTTFCNKLIQNFISVIYKTKQFVPPIQKVLYRSGFLHQLYGRHTIWKLSLHFFNAFQVLCFVMSLLKMLYLKRKKARNKNNAPQNDEQNVLLELSYHHISK